MDKTHTHLNRYTHIGTTWLITIGYSVVVWYHSLWYKVLSVASLWYGVVLVWSHFGMKLS